MSARSEVAARLESFLNELGLNEVYGVIAGGGGKSPRSLTFCTVRTLDGEVRVYGPNFIQVRWTTAYRDMPRQGSRVFESADNAMQFLNSAFVEHDYEGAFEVPARASK